MIRFPASISGVLLTIMIYLIIWLCHFGLIMLLWKWLVVGIFGLPMINLGETIGLYVLVGLIVNRQPVKMAFVKKKEEDD